MSIWRESGRVLRSDLLAGALIAATLSAPVQAQVEEETVTRDDLTDYVYQAIAAQRPTKEISEINAVIIDGELTGYKVTYSNEDMLEFTADGHVVGRNPDSEQSYNQSS